MSTQQAAPDFAWTRQFGSPLRDSAEAVSSDATGAYVAGLTSGSFPAQTSAGKDDAFLQKYDPSGNVAWTRQFGTPEDDWADGVSADGTGAYITGATNGVFPGQTSAGDWDGFLRRYDGGGNIVWTRQFGTSAFDGAATVSADITGAYVAGITYDTPSSVADAFLTKYDPSGNFLWARQFGSDASDQVFSVAADGANLYAAGVTWGTLPGQSSAGYADAFIRKYDGSGNTIWTRQFGSPGIDYLFSVSADSTGGYAAGSTNGALPGQTNAGYDDVVVVKFDANGNIVWTHQFGTPDFELARAVSGDATGAYVVGATTGTLPGQTSAGGNDAFLQRYDSNGTVLWTRQFGSSTFDIATAVDASGKYVAGFTDGVLTGQVSNGAYDAFIARLEGAIVVCPLSQGFWKNHAALWPTSSLALGVQTYAKQELLALFRTPPRGDASVILAHQLIAAKLNVANGSDPAPISAALTAANALLSGYSGKVPYGVRMSTADGREMTAAAETLDAYNNGLLTPGCERTSQPPSAGTTAEGAYAGEAIEKHGITYPEPSSGPRGFFLGYPRPRSVLRDGERLSGRLQPPKETRAEPINPQVAFPDHKDPGFGTVSMKNGGSDGQGVGPSSRSMSTIEWTGSTRCVWTVAGGVEGVDAMSNGPTSQNNRRDTN